MSSTMAADGRHLRTADVDRSSSRLRYRADIDGLRALAVLAVIAYHANPRVLAGGFAGVDVFFVISGYLITGLLLQRRTTGTTLRAFFERRIRRIFPALILVLAATMLAGWQVLLPSEWTQLCSHVAAGAAFVVDIVFWREAGYFDVAAARKPLLHLWSLAVEEQFYLAWPLIVMAGAAVGRVRRVALWLLAASFALNLWWVTRDGAAAFFLLPARMWELATGGVLACVPAWPGEARAPWRRDTVAGIGMLLLLVAFVGLDGSRHYPGAWALLPVLGTAALVHAGPQAAPNRLLLERPALVYVGLISYPLYLWHWPALSFARIVAGADPGWQAVAVAIAVAALLAALTYHCFERPLRALRRLPTVPLLLALAVLAVIGLAGASGRLAPRHAQAPWTTWDAALRDWDYPPAKFVAAKVGDGLSVRAAGSGRAVLVIGDSNAQQYAPRFAALLDAAPTARRVIFATAGSCPPMRGLDFAGRAGCPRIAERALAFATDPAVDDVVFAAQWTAYLDPRVATFRGVAGADAVEQALEAFTETLRALRVAGKRVHVVLNIPVGPVFEPRELLRRAWFAPFGTATGGTTRAAWEASSAFATDALRAAAERAGASVIDPADSLCAAGRCPAVDGAGAPLYRDGYHLRASFVREHVRYLDAIVLPER